MSVGPPAPAPCGSCPYRLDVPSGVWDEQEYAKLEAFDRPTGEQPPTVFLCHRQDGRLCAGWVGCHEMEESLGLRVATATGLVPPEVYEEALDYRTDVPLFASGEEAAEHGRREIAEPSRRARTVVQRLRRKGL